MAREPRKGRGGKSSPRGEGSAARRAKLPPGEQPKPREKPPIRDLDHLDLEEAHASGEHLNDINLDEDDELTQWQDDPRRNQGMVRNHSSARDDDMIELDDDSVVPPSAPRPSLDTLSTDDSLEEDLGENLHTEDPERPSRGDHQRATPAPHKRKGLPRAPLMNPFSQGAEASSPETYVDRTIDPEEEPTDFEEVPDELKEVAAELEMEPAELEMESAELEPEISLSDDFREIDPDREEGSRWSDREPVSQQASRMNLVHVSLDPDDPDAGLSLDDDMETDLLDLTPAGTSYDELERLENQVERLEEEDRLDEALSALRLLQLLLPADSDLQYRYEDLQLRVIQSYFPGKTRDSVVHLSVEPHLLPDLIKHSESELGSLLSRMDGATALGDLDQALGDLEPGTLYRLLSRAKGKGLIRLE